MSRYTLSISAILLLCISFGANASFENKVYWSISGFAEIDRSSTHRNAPGYYAKSVDTTTFSVNHNAFLTQVDLPELFYLSSEGQAVSIDTPFEAVVDIVDGTDLWQGIVEITPNQETKVIITPPIHLEADGTYQVRVRLPQNHIYAFDGEFSHKSFRVQSRLGYGHVTVNFFDFNHGHSDVYGFDRNPSVGMVKKIHLNRQYDEASDE